MSTADDHFELKLDPWAASSLLQKAIRRGEPGLAQSAARTLHGFRGKAVWRRLMTIAVEDIGIADLGLLAEVTLFASDPKLRLVLGSEDELLRESSIKLALATKDRSADYLYCSATKLPAAIEERRQLQGLSQAELHSIAGNVAEPSMRRFSASLLACTTGFEGEAVSQPSLDLLLSSLPRTLPVELESALATLATARVHPFVLALVPLWTQFEWTGGARGVVTETVPEASFVSGVPLYAYDKHTSAGKRALTALASECQELRELLDEWVPRNQHASVTQMAAFYADASPISLRLEWFAGRHLEFIGMHADMMSVGCTFEGVIPITDCLRRNLPTLNDCRRAALIPARRLR